jgi:hypothetical protein
VDLSQTTSMVADSPGETGASTSDATWAGLLLMALWGVVAALNESEISRKIEQQKRMSEDDAITGNAIVRQMKKLKQTVIFIHSF